MKQAMEDRQERALLVSCLRAGRDEQRMRLSLEELAELARTAGVAVEGVFTQRRESVDAAWYLGRGKIAEIAQAAAEQAVDLVIFNDELSPTQKRNLESLIACKVIDRTQLILDIFASRAHSREGKLQVELAQYRYLLPRLGGQGSQLSRLGGGIGTRGPGETKLETDRRHIRRRIRDLEQQLADVVRTRQLHRERRKKNSAFQIALVGYTNAGKSTLLNRLTAAGILAEDKLFATLDPTTRQLTLPGGTQVLLTDTVGFIQDLPTTLVAAFRSTLEGVREADLLLHVVDSHHPDCEVHMEVVENVLHELEADAIPRLVVYNKADLLPEGTYLPPAAHAILISAFRDDDLRRLLAAIEELVCRSYGELTLRIPADRGDLLSLVYREGTDLRQEFDEAAGVFQVQVRLNQQSPAFARLFPYVVNNPQQPVL
ncbi:GTPase HflX [Brevibacillus marinus]|uniref:GTPase HflX n=1 Tax=Brevibacillus marinus TaxID=2496837 RepID=UPI000F82BE21|nr:GTPase HflX [Brevibacillus marinus]